jgi:hypothetical protein
MRRRPMHFPRSVVRGFFLGPHRVRTRLSLVLLIGIGFLLALTTGSGRAASGPSITFTCSSRPSCVGWYTSNVTVTWAYSDPSGILNTDGCNTHTVTTDTKGSAEHCYVENGNQVWAKVDLSIAVDKTPPQITAVAPDRAPDSNGWYTHPVTIAWGGSDATSGLAGCTSLTYSAPDTGAASATGTCRDNAGNVASAPFGFKYDGTAPVLSKVTMTSGATADVLRWTSSSASDTAVVQRSARGNKDQPIVFRGTGSSFADKKIQSSLEYTYSVQTSDQAGNASQKISVDALPKVLTLRKLPYVPRVSSKPILRWEAKRRASYYHVQLFRGSKRIFAAWPVKNELGLPAAWKWAGHRYRLGPGQYRWYVWAGLGRRSFAHYKALGSARFIVPRH